MAGPHMMGDGPEAPKTFPQFGAGVPRFLASVQVHLVIPSPAPQTYEGYLRCPYMLRHMLRGGRRNSVVGYKLVLFLGSLDLRLVFCSSCAIDLQDNRPEARFLANISVFEYF